MELTLREIGKILDADARMYTDKKISGISTDSRTIKEGMVFFALKGTHYDGHDYVLDAFSRGAMGAVVDINWISSPQNIGDQNVIPVQCPLRSLQDVASCYRMKFQIPVIGITGTNGKTTTKEMVAAVLETKFRVVKSPGNLNNHIGVPLTIFQWDQYTEIAVMELGTNHFGEIRRLCEIAKPTHGVITNIGKGHLEFFGDINGVAKAKSELIESLPVEGMAFLNGDDPRLIPLKKKVRKTVTYGFSDDCEFRAHDLGMDDRGCYQMTVNHLTIRIPIPGRHNLYNGLSAAAVGRAFKIPWRQIRSVLEKSAPVENRMVVINHGGLTIIDDTYNANPTSVRLALMTLQQMKGLNRKIAVLGDMLELGNKSQMEHQHIGELVVKMGLDGLFCYGEEMKMAAERAKQLGLLEVGYFDSQNDLLNELLKIVDDGDGILVKGSRGMKMEGVVEGIKKKWQAST